MKKLSLPSTLIWITIYLSFQHLSISPTKTHNTNSSTFSPKHLYPTHPNTKEANESHPTAFKDLIYFHKTKKPPYIDSPHFHWLSNHPLICIFGTKCLLCTPKNPKALARDWLLFQWSLFLLIIWVICLFIKALCDFNWNTFCHVWCVVSLEL